MTIKDTFTFFGQIAWPLIVLIIVLLFRRSLLLIFSTFSDFSKHKERNMRLKFGGFEIETLANKAEERIMEIASEPDLNKRLEMAKKPFLIDDAIKNINESELKSLQILANSKLQNSFLINWYQPINGLKHDEIHSLYKKGLISGSPMYDGDEVAWFTPVGLAVIEKLKLEKINAEKK
jgi:hypothetical protein